MGEEAYEVVANFQGPINLLLAAALGLKGDTDEAGATLTEAINQLSSKVRSIAQIRTGALPYLSMNNPQFVALRDNPQFVALREKTVFAGLRRAGMPEE